MSPTPDASPVNNGQLQYPVTQKRTRRRTSGYMKPENYELVLEWLARPGNAKLWFGFGDNDKKQIAGGEKAYTKITSELTFFWGYTSSGIKNIIARLKKAHDTMDTEGGPPIKQVDGEEPTVQVTNKIEVPKQLLESAFVELPRGDMRHFNKGQSSARDRSEDTVTAEPEDPLLTEMDGYEITNEDDEEEEEDEGEGVPSTSPLSAGITTHAEGSYNALLEELVAAKQMYTTNGNHERVEDEDSSILMTTNITSAHTEVPSNTFLSRWRSSSQEQFTRTNGLHRKRGRDRIDTVEDELRSEREHERKRELFQWKKDEDIRRAQFERESLERKERREELDHRRRMEREEELHKRRLEQEEELHRMRLKRMRFEFMKEHGISIDRV